MKIKKDTALTTSLVACALVTTGIVLWREFLEPRASQGTEASRKAVRVENWQSYLRSGIQLGPHGAVVQVIEFADFECPFCAISYKDLKRLRARYTEQVAVTFVHFPLEGHRFAVPAARSAECAGDQGHFEAMHDQLFAQQDQFGLKPWTDIAKDAAVPDLTAFETCTKRTDPIPRVEEGKALGNKLNIQGTPTVIINGWQLGHPPSAEELDKMVKRILAGKPPVDA